MGDKVALHLPEGPGAVLEDIPSPFAGLVGQDRGA
jgi:hypothetical protein